MPQALSSTRLVLARLMEVQYLTQVPDLLEIVRRVMALPDEERAKMLQFFEK
ncbi:hypothetical protein MXD81_27930 [Microbacteriaceae bacterium K1510]|nr:hypothetical protein [Microbacteriaceae bacterium K1510]